MLLQYGITTVKDTWNVTELTATGYMRIYYIYGGDVQYFQEGIQKRLLPERLYIFPSASPYSICSNPENPLSCLFVHIEIGANILSDIMEINPNENPFIKDFFKTLSHVILCRSTELISGMIEVFEAYCQKNRLFPNPPSEIASVLNYMHNNREKEMRVIDLSNIAGYSREYFIRLFKKYCGVPPYRYLTNIRLNESIKQLKQGRSITYAAKVAGYSEIKAYNKAFRNKFGVSPSCWKNKYTTLP